MLSIPKYAGLCVLGTEIFYVLCIAYGSLLVGKAQELHHALFGLIPGFAWGNPVSMIWGGVFFGVIAWMVGWYVAWMHNTSLITSRR